MWVTNERKYEFYYLKFKKKVEKGGLEKNKNTLQCKYSRFYVINCCCSVVHSCLNLCNPRDCSTPSFPVLHCLPELFQSHVHWPMMPSNHLILCHSLLLLFLIFPAFGSIPISQLFASSGQSIVSSISASVLLVSVQGWFLLRLTGLISLQSKRLSRVFSSSTVWKHQFFSIQLSLWSNSGIHDYWKNHSFD